MRASGGEFTASAGEQPLEVRAMTQASSLSPLITLDYENTLVLAIELSKTKWVLAAPCCMDRGCGRTAPTHVQDYAMRTYSGRPSSSIRFSTSAAMATCNQVADLGLQPGFLLAGGGPGVADDRHALAAATASKRYGRHNAAHPVSMHMAGFVWLCLFCRMGLTTWHWRARSSRCGKAAWGCVSRDQRSSDRGRGS